MEERTTPIGPAERAPAGQRVGEARGDDPGPPHLADPRALTILTTEHWSLLTARTLVYNEAFARGGMFLTFVTGTLVALGFVSQGTGFGREFLVVTTVLLAFVLLIGFATIGRLASAGDEEFRAIQGMNRLRHAYLEMVPSLEPYLSASTFDDTASVLSTYAPEDEAPGSAFRNFLHALTTMPGLVGLITAVVAGAFASSVTLLLGSSAAIAIAVGGVGFVVGVLAMAWIGLKGFNRLAERSDVRFPRPPVRPGT